MPARFDAIFPAMDEPGFVTEIRGVLEKHPRDMRRTTVIEEQPAP
jgi:hypothetical protein